MPLLSTLGESSLREAISGGGPRRVSRPARSHTWLPTCPWLRRSWLNSWLDLIAKAAQICAAWCQEDRFSSEYFFSCRSAVSDRSAHACYGRVRLYSLFSFSQSHSLAGCSAATRVKAEKCRPEFPIPASINLFRTLLFFSHYR